MFDAEIAAVLLNRYALAGQAAVELLREGKLEFTAEYGSLETRDAGGQGGAQIDGLRFADGSRVLRIASDRAAWTGWVAFAPPAVAAVSSEPGSELAFAEG